MKRLMVFLPLLVFAVCKFSPVMAALPFGPGSQNGNAAYHTVYTDTLRVGSAVITGPVGLAALGDSLKNEHPKVYADTIKGSVLDVSPWMVDVPIYPDSVSTALDSLTVLLIADMTLPTEYSHYLHAFGNGTAPADSIRLLRSFRPQIVDPDSMYWWVYSNAAGDSSNYSFVIRGKNAAGVMDSVVTTGVIRASAMNTWKRVSVAAGWFYSGWYDAILRIRLSYGSKMSISPIYFK